MNFYDNINNLVSAFKNTEEYTKYQELKRTYAECIYKNILLPLDSRGQAGSSRIREG